MRAQPVPQYIEVPIERVVTREVPVEVEKVVYRDVPQEVQVVYQDRPVTVVSGRILVENASLSCES